MPFEYETGDFWLGSRAVLREKTSDPSDPVRPVRPCPTRQARQTRQPPHPVLTPSQLLQLPRAHYIQGWRPPYGWVG